MLSLKDKLITDVAEELEIPEELVEKIIHWTFLKTKEATVSCKEIELSGFGKLSISQAKVKRRIKNLHSVLSNIAEGELAKTSSIDEKINDLKTKLNGVLENI